MPQTKHRLLLKIFSFKIGIERQYFGIDTDCAKNVGNATKHICCRFFRQISHIVAAHFGDSLICFEQIGLRTISIQLFEVHINFFLFREKHLQNFCLREFLFVVQLSKQSFFLFLLQSAFPVCIIFGKSEQIMLLNWHNHTRHFNIVEPLPNLEFLEQRRRLWTYTVTDSLDFLFAFNLNFNLSAFKLAERNQTLLRFKWSLIENHHITNFFLEFRGEFFVKSCLRFPNCFKLIQIVLTIENLIFQTIVGILVQLRHLILTNCLMIEI